MNTELEALSDADLLAACRDGRQAAWAALVRRYQRLVYTVPRRAGLGEAQAADVFQFAFARLFEHLHRIAEPSRVQAWLVTTAKRETLRLINESRRFVDLVPAGDADDAAEHPLERLPDESPLPEALLDDLQQQDRVRRAVERLDPKSRLFCELLFLQEDPLPYGEIAARLGMAEGSIGPTRARCLEKLRKLLRDM